MLRQAAQQQAGQGAMWVQGFNTSAVQRKGERGITIVAIAYRGFARSFNIIGGDVQGNGVGWGWGGNINAGQRAFVIRVFNRIGGVTGWGSGI